MPDSAHVTSCKTTPRCLRNGHFCLFLPSTERRQRHFTQQRCAFSSWPLRQITFVLLGPDTFISLCPLVSSHLERCENPRPSEGGRWKKKQQHQNKRRHRPWLPPSTQQQPRNHRPLLHGSCVVEPLCCLQRWVSTAVAIRSLLVFSPFCTSSLPNGFVFANCFVSTEQAGQPRSRVLHPNPPR